MVGYLLSFCAGTTRNVRRVGSRSGRSKVELYVLTVSKNIFMDTLETLFFSTKSVLRPQNTHENMHSCSPAGGGCRASASCSSSMNHRHKRVAFRGPLSLLWLALLAVATGPAACFVVLPSSTCLRGAGFFAAASPLPKVVLGSRQGSCGARHSSGSGGGGREQRRVFSRARRGEDPAREEQQLEEEEDEEEEHKNEEDTYGGRQNALPKARSHSFLASSTGIRNARAFRAVTALSEGKGFRAAASVLRASATGVELDSRVAQTDSPPKRVLILMSDTGGGHRASSQALTAALEDLYGDQVGGRGGREGGRAAGDRTEDAHL